MPHVPSAAERRAFVKALKAAMTRRGMAVSGICRASGLPKQTLSVYLNGTFMPGRVRLLALARALDVKPTSLVPSHTEPRPPLSEDVVAQIEERRKARGWTRRTLAIRAGYSPSKLSFLLNGDPPAAEDTLPRLQAALDAEDDVAPQPPIPDHVLAPVLTPVQAGPASVPSRARKVSRVKEAQPFRMEILADGRGRARLSGDMELPAADAIEIMSIMLRNQSRQVPST